VGGLQGLVYNTGMPQQILILEDEQDVALLYAKRLKSHGYEPTVAFNGLEGIEKLKGMTPDLILLDINMPGMGGLEFYRHICGHSAKPPYPVLVLTARASLEELFRDFNVDGFMVKPFDGERLLAEVEAILKKNYNPIMDDNAKRVTIVDDSEGDINKLLAAFSGSGYIMDSVSGGAIGIEKIMGDPPHLALVNLSLYDMGGDEVILKLQQMKKTKHVRFILYARKSAQYDRMIVEKFSAKSGVRLMCEYETPKELVKAAEEMFEEMRQ
jgi:DNA-binding response OmpR family regulator